MQQPSLFDQGGESSNRKPFEIVEVFTMQQANKYREMGAQLFCACSDSPHAEITVIRYSQGAFQVKITNTHYWITPHRVWAEVPRT